MYVRDRRLLLYVACRKFRVPHDDADALVNEVFLALLTATGHIESPRAWLVGAICNASRQYHKRASRYTWRDEHAKVEVVDTEVMTRELVVRDLLQRLRARDRELLRLHYFEGLTVPAIAARMNLTPRYVQKLVAMALGRLRKLYHAAPFP